MFLRISKFFLYASVFSVVVVLPFTFFPFIGGKYYFFRVAVEMALALFVLWWAFDSEGARLAPQWLKNFYRQPLVIAVSIFVAIFLLASIFAYDPHLAFWSNYERGDGGFQMLHYYAFFVLLGVIFRKDEDWRKLFWLSLVAAALMILYGLLATAFVPGFFGPYTKSNPLSPSFWGRLFHPSSRFQGSLGNPAYVSPYLMFSMFYLLYLWWSRKGRRPGIGWVYGGLTLFFLLFFVLGQTRGAFLGLVAAVVTFLVFLIFGGGKQFRKLGGWLFLLVIFGGSLLFYLRDTALVKSLPGSRFLEFNFTTLTVQTRFWTWGSAWQGIKERPLLGWGPENFSAVFDKYFDPRHFMPGRGGETWFDRAHSIVFDYLAETGILGFAAFLGIWATFFWELAKRRVWFDSPLLNGLFFAVPVGYLVQGIAIFDVLPIYLNVFVFLAFFVYLINRASVVTQDASRSARVVYIPSIAAKIFCIAVAAALVVFAYIGSFLPWRKSEMFTRGMRASEALVKDGKISAADFEKLMSPALLAPSPIGQEELVRQTAWLARDLIAGGLVAPGDLVNFVESFYAPIIKRGRVASIGQSLYALGWLHYSALMKTGDIRYLAVVISYLEDGLIVSPNRPQFLYGLFDAYRLAGDLKRAKEVGEKIVSLWPMDEKVAAILKEL